MIFKLCAACQHVNGDDAQRCVACGGWLIENDDTVPAALLHVEPTPAESPGALWLDDVGLPLLAIEPAAPEEPALSITLRDIDTPLLPRDSAFGRLAPSPPAPAPHADEFALPILDLSVELAPAVEVRGSVAAPHDADATARAATKAARRAAVRRARLGHEAAGITGAAVAIPEVMVLDPDDRARTELCTLLGAFGFRVHPVLDIEQATELSAERPFAAVFVDIVLDGSDGGAGVQMCRQVKGGFAPGTEPPVLVLVSAQFRPVDRVRAKLAGCDGMLLKPVARGDVARLLESSGVALPSDARRR